jgi:fumarylacetoacetase
MATTSWVPVPAGSPFPVTNLPYGVFSDAGGERRLGVAIGEHVLDLAAAADAVAPPDPDVGRALRAAVLNPLMALGRPAWRETRRWISGLLTDGDRRTRLEPHLHLREQVGLHLPFEVADYVDFYSSEHHAANVGRIFRPDGPPLRENWRHLPIGYHGRSATVVVSGTAVTRPRGHRRGADGVDVGPSQRLDVEAEVGFVVGTGSTLGAPVPVGAFADHVFGVCLVNDWSARDIQAFETVPLGPFLGKSFATSVSPWVVPLAALEAARVPAPTQEPAPAAHLRPESSWALDLALEIEWNGTVVSRPPFAGMYWTPDQQLAHLTSNGASVRTGDLYASGTVSGPAREERGCFLELSWDGTQAVELADGETRTFLEDGDTVVIRATAAGLHGTRIGLGEVAGTVRPASR